MQQISLFKVRLVITFVLMTLICLSQTPVTGTLLDSLKKPGPYVAVGLSNTNDSLVFKGTMTDDKGGFVFENIRPGNYYVIIKSAGHADVRSANFEHDSLKPTQLQPLIAGAKTTNLEEVAIVTTQNLLEFKNGNTIVNIANSALAAGNSLYDILSRMPGVMVDGDNITLQGRSVGFMLDDRLQKMSGSQLTGLLKSINASDVDKIELITNPSAKYDATGGGGLINIKTKKVKLTGFSGNAMYSYSQGMYANNYGNVSLNYKGKKLTVFTNSNFNVSDYIGINKWVRRIDEDTVVTYLDQEYREKTNSRYVSLWGGVDWSINDKHTLSARYTFRPGSDAVHRDVTTNISNNNLGYEKLAMSFDKPNEWFWVDYELNYEFLPDTNGTKLNFNASYSRYPDLYEGYFNNKFMDSENNDVLAPKVFQGWDKVELKMLTYRFDLEKKLPGKAKLEGGLKLSDQVMSSDFEFRNYNYNTGQMEVDSSLTNKFLYNELIPAAYLELNKEIKKFNVRVGLRGEQTTIDAEGRSATITYTRSYFNIFPTASVDYNLSADHNFQVSVNRRIQRADYNNFNPVRQFRTMLTYVQGNPFLNPQYTNNLQLRHTYKGGLSNTLSFSQMQGYFVSYNKENETTKELVFFMENLRQASIYSYNLYYQDDFFKFWNFSFGSGVHYFYANGIIDRLPYTTSALNMNAYTNNQLSVNKTTKIEIVGWGLGPWTDGVTKFKPRGAMNVGVKKTMLDDKLSATLTFQDIFLSMPVQTTINYNGQYSESYHRWDSRRVMVVINYSFGKIRVQQKQLKENEEKNRAGR